LRTRSQKTRKQTQSASISNSQSGSSAGSILLLLLLLPIPKKGWFPKHARANKPSWNSENDPWTFWGEWWASSGSNPCPGGSERRSNNNDGSGSRASLTTTTTTTTGSTTCFGRRRHLRSGKTNCCSRANTTTTISTKTKTTKTGSCRLTLSRRTMHPLTSTLPRENSVRSIWTSCSRTARGTATALFGTFLLPGRFPMPSRGRGRGGNYCLEIRKTIGAARQQTIVQTRAAIRCAVLYARTMCSNYKYQYQY